MKSNLLLSLILLYSLSLTAQKKRDGYTFLMPSVYVGTKSAQSALYGAAVGFAAVKGKGSLGIGIEYLTKKDAGAYIPIYADLHVFLMKKAEGPFIAAQPGYIIRSRKYSVGGSTVSETGGLYFGAGIGFVSSIKKIGVTGIIKYALLNTKAKFANTSVSTNANSIALQLGIAF